MEQLPMELVAEILFWVPTKSLARFRTLCKPWKAILEDKSFLNNYFAHHPQFILHTNSKIYSVDINLNHDHVSLREIALDDIPCQRKICLVHCDGFLLSSDLWKKGFAVWNPWLSQNRWVVSDEKHEFKICGMGYDSTRLETGYKIFGFRVFFDGSGKLDPKVAIYECKSDKWKCIVNPSWDQDWRVPLLDTIVSLNGNLYWTAYDSKTCKNFIRSFDFSKEMFKTFCLVPWNEEYLDFTQVLAVFKGDRFSVLRQCYMTRKVEILVTKDKIDGNGEAVEWMSFMKVSIPNFPRLQEKCIGSSQPSYLVDDKRLFVCTCDETRHACIYIVKGDVFRKIPIDSVVDIWPSHLTYIPSFIPIPEENNN